MSCAPAIRVDSPSDWMIVVLFSLMAAAAGSGHLKWGRFDVAFGPQTMSPPLWVGILRGPFSGSESGSNLGAALPGVG